MNEWTVFFGAIAGAAATLLGLAFVAFQLSPSWHHEPLRRIVAVQTLAEFLIPLILALTALMPGDRWRSCAVAAGLVGLGLVIVQLVTLRRHSASARRFDVVQGYLAVIPLLVYAAISAAGFLDTDAAASVLAIALLWSLISGAIEAFAFMSQRKTG